MEFNSIFTAAIFFLTFNERLRRLVHSRVSRFPPLITKEDDSHNVPFNPKTRSAKQPPNLALLMRRLLGAAAFFEKSQRLRGNTQTTFRKSVGDFSFKNTQQNKNGDNLPFLSFRSFICWWI